MVQMTNRQAYLKTEVVETNTKQQTQSATEKWQQERKKNGAGHRPLREINAAPAGKSYSPPDS
ncbi:hypothetical protein GCM10009413_32390 [Tatumella punctata]